MSAELDRPSGRAVERLATGVGEDVSDLRAQLHRALDEADRLQAAGREDLAVSVLQEQRDALVAVHRQLEARLADAVVEREAEGVLDAAASSAPLRDATAARTEAVAARGPATDRVPATVDDDNVGLRLLAAAAAAVLGVTLLLTPEPGSGGVTAAGSSAASGAHLPGDAPRAIDDGTSPHANRPTPTSEPEADEPGPVRDSWALALPEAEASSTTDEAGDRDHGADVADVAGLLPLPAADTPLDALTSDPTGLAVDDDEMGDHDGGTAVSGADERTASDGDGGGTTDGSSDSREAGTEQQGGGPQGGSASSDGGTDGTATSDGAAADDDQPDGEAGAGDGSLDVDGSGEVTTGLER